MNTLRRNFLLALVGTTLAGTAIVQAADEAQSSGVAWKQGIWVVRANPVPRMPTPIVRSLIARNLE